MSADSLVSAQREDPGVVYATCDGKHLPFGEGQFDVVFAINVLHHVGTSSREAFLREMTRVCRAGGLVVVFEHNRCNPLTRLVVRLCPFDRNTVLLRRGEVIRLFQKAGLRLDERRFVLIFPSGWKIVSWVETALSQLPLGAQYYVAGRK